MSNGKVIIKGKEADRIVERALKAGWALKLTRHSWGNRRKLAQDLLEEKFEKDAEAINAVQKLLLCKELQEVNRCISYINKKVDDLGRPWLGEGVYWFIEEYVPIMEEELVKTAVEMKNRLEAFLIVYEERKRDHKEKHPKLYREEHYPRPDRMREKFGLEWNWQRFRPTVSTEDVGVVSKDIVDRETAKFRDLMKSGVEVVVEAARQSTLEVLEHLRDCLKDKDKKFQDSSVEKPKQYLEELQKTLAFLDDSALNKVIADSQSILNGVYGGDLRDDVEYRKVMAGVMDTVVKEFKAIPLVELERDIEL
jgi:hypothetical protein